MSASSRQRPLLCLRIILQSELISEGAGTVDDHLGLHLELLILDLIVKLSSNDVPLFVLHEVHELDVVGHSGCLLPKMIILDSGREDGEHDLSGIIDLSFRERHAVVFVDVDKGREVLLQLPPEMEGRAWDGHG